MLHTYELKYAILKRIEQIENSKDQAPDEERNDKEIR